MLSEKLVGELKSKTKLLVDQINSVTELEGWEIIQDSELLNRGKGDAIELECWEIIQDSELLNRK